MKQTPKTGSSSDRRRAASAQPKSGVPIQSQLVWLQRTQDIYFKTFVSIFRFFFFQPFIFLTYFSFLFIVYCPHLYCVGPSAGATGRPFLVKQARVSLHHLLTSSSPSRISLRQQKRSLGGFFKTKSPCSVGHDMFNRLSSNF